MHYLAPLQLPTTAAAVSLLLIPLMWRVAPRLGLVDMPDARKVHTVPVPRVGGFGITIGFLLPLLLWLNWDPMLQSLVIGTLVLFLFGVWDDARDIGHWPKFLGQVIAAGVVVFYGDLYVTRVPFLDDDLSAAVGKPLTMFALVGVINAINHSDGLDGLAAGESMLSLIGLAILGYLSGSVLMISVALAAMGGILGFLRYNSYPARVFMGDAGSQVLGFMLGFLTVYLTQIANTAISAAAPLLLLGVPIADILLVLYRRIRGGNNWFKASRNHAHHRLLDLGFAHHETVVLIYSLQALFVVAAVLLCYSPDLNVAATYVLTIVGAFALLASAERRGWRRVTGEQRGAARPAYPGAVAQRMLHESPWRLIAVAAPAFMLLGSLWVARVPRDIAWVAGGLALVLSTVLWLRHAVRSSLVRLTVYITAIASAYLVVSYPGMTAQRPVEITAVALVVSLVAAIAAYVRYTGERKFGTTPTDFLIALTLLALLIFAGFDSNSRPQIEIVVYAVVLLYGCEVLIGRAAQQRWSALNTATLATLMILAIRGAL